MNILKYSLLAIAITFIATVVLWMSYVGFAVIRGNDALEKQRLAKITKTLFRFLSRIWVIAATIMIGTFLFLLVKTLLSRNTR
jgi:hypothetical protein